MIHIVLDNIRSVFNVGSIFRTADGVGNCKLYLCGITAPVGHPKIEKTALGASLSVPSEQFDKTEDAIKALKKKKVPIYSVELTKGSQDYREVSYPGDVAFVLGHEKKGVQKEIMELSDKVIHIPMHGMKKSLNVATVTGIILYEAIREKKSKK